MSLAVIVYVLTALAAVVVVLTRLRLRGEGGGAGRLSVPQGLVNAHTVAGTGRRSGVRGRPRRGRPPTETRHDSWSDGPGLSVLAHVGMLVGVCVFTFAYLTSAV